MAWVTPKTNWIAADGVSATDFNRIEGNALALKTAATIDIVDTGNYITATNVETALQELGLDLGTGKTSLATAITAKGQASTSVDSLATMATKIGLISNDATAVAGDLYTGKTAYMGGAKVTGTFVGTGNATLANVLTGVTFYNTDLKAKLTGTMPDFSRATLGTGAVYKTPVSVKPDGTGYLVFEPPTGYYTTGLNAGGFGSIAQFDANYVSSNIKAGVTIFGLGGTLDYSVGASVNAFKISPPTTVATVGQVPMTGSPNEPFTMSSGGTYHTPFNTALINKFNPDGSAAWTFTATGTVSCLAVTASDTYLYYINSVTSTLYKIKTSDRSVVWSMPSAGTGNSGNNAGRNMICDSADNVYYFSNSDNSVRKVNSAGTQQWSKVNASMNPCQNMRLSPDEQTLYLLAGQDQFQATANVFLWKVTTAGAGGTLTSFNVSTNAYAGGLLVPSNTTAIVTTAGTGNLFHLINTTAMTLTSQINNSSGAPTEFIPYLVPTESSTGLYVCLGSSTTGYIYSNLTQVGKFTLPTGINGVAFITWAEYDPVRGDIAMQYTLSGQISLARFKVTQVLN